MQTMLAACFRFWQLASTVHSVQDHGTKWYDNRALTNRSATSIAIQLVDIFTQIGPPCILQCDNGTEFKGIAGKKASLKDSDVVEIIKCIKDMWPGCTLVNGRARHSQSQGVRSPSS